MREGFLDNKLNKTILVYLFAALFAFVFDKVYSIFSHGVSSDTMSNMFIWVLVCGAVFGIIRISIPKIYMQKGYRIFYNIYNSGVAALITGMLLQGILEIAGGSSEYLRYYSYTAYTCIVISAIVFVPVIIEYLRKQNI